MSPEFLAAFIGIPVFHSTLLLLLWVFIIVRIISIKRSDNEFPSKWRRTSSWCIFLSGCLDTAYLALFIAKSVMSYKTEHLAESKDFYPSSVPVPSSYVAQSAGNFTEAQLAMTASHYDEEVRMMLAARSCLTVALWLAKFAFLSFLLGNLYYLKRNQKWVLITTCGVVAAMFVVVLWASFYGWGTLPALQADTALAYDLFAGVGFVSYEPFLEIILGSFNIGADILVTACACYILRSMTTTSKHSGALLIFLLGLTTTTAALRLAFVAITAYGYTGQNGAPTKFKAILATQFLLDIDTVTSIIISCIPAIRSWSRNFRSRRALIKPEEAVREDSLGAESRRIDNEELSLERSGESQCFVPERERSMIEV